MNEIILGFIFLLLGGSSSALLADSVACTGPLGVSISCSSSPLDITARFPGTPSVSGNVLSIPDTFVQISDPGNFTTPQGNAVSATVTVDDTFDIPNSPAGDVLKISGVFGEGTLGSDECCAVTSELLQFGPGNNASPGISINPRSGDYQYCYKSAACQINVTVQADAFSYFTLQGSAFLQGNANTYNLLASFDSLDFTISRYKADGVTPDPFTTMPEPASWALMAGAGGILALIALRHRQISLS